MDIDGLKTFVAIAELGGFTRAGARLHRSQPAISRRLGLLEQELGAPLFDRLRGRARLTEAGRAFRPHAEAALAALKDGQRGRARPAVGPVGQPVARPGRHAGRHAHRRYAQPLPPPGPRRAARAAHRVECGGDRPGAPRRGHARPALLLCRRRRSRHPCGRRGGDAGGGGRGAPSRRPARAQHQGLARRTLDRLSAGAQRARFLRATCSPASSCAPGSTTPTSR